MGSTETKGTFIVNQDIKLGDYLHWINSILNNNIKRRNQTINEYILIHANPWIIDSLRNTDYYLLKSKGIINYDSKELVIIKKDQYLNIPDSFEILSIQNKLISTYIDINIPEFKLRIISKGKVLHELPIRVGKKETRYFKMSDHEMDLRTKTGVGSIVRVNRNPLFINPENNHRYEVTLRDDGVETQLPNIPWLEPEINGHRYGQLIHPTTNLRTIGKALSNGCIGLREADAWLLYYYAPIGTEVVIRYDLEVLDENDICVRLEDIYPDTISSSIDSEMVVSNSKKHFVNVCTCTEL